MPRLSKKQLDAIAWYSQEHQLIPQLSLPPLIRFRDKKSGAEIKRQIANLVSEYEKANRQNK